MTMPSQPAVTAPASPPLAPAHHYIRTTRRVMIVWMTIVVLALIVEGLGQHFQWPDTVMLAMVVVQCLVLGMLIGPTLPIWRPVPRRFEAPSTEPESVTYRDGF